MKFKLLMGLALAAAPLTPAMAQTMNAEQFNKRECTQAERRDGYLLARRD